MVLLFAKYGAFLFFQLLDDTAWIASCHTVRGDIVCYHTASTYDTAVANGHSWANGDIASKPAIFSNLDGVGRLDGLATLQVVDRVLWGIKRTIWSYQCVATNSDVGSIEEHRIIVDEYAFAQV